MRKLLTLLFLSLFFTETTYAASYEHDGITLGGNIKTLKKGQYSCSPSFLPNETQCIKNIPGTLFGVPAKKVELMFKNGRCYTIFIGFAPGDTPKIGKALEQKYGAPSKAAQVLKGVYQVKWQQGNRELVLNRDDKRSTANVTMVEY